jgi:aldose sugar dehydrogenase
MSKYFFWIAAILLVACTQAPKPLTPVDVFGTIDLHVSSDGQISKAQLVDESKLVFTATAVTVVDASSMRFINASFTVQNNTGADLSNLTLYAYSQTANNVAGTALKNLENFAGTPLSTGADLVKPTHGMLNAQNINTAQADLQLFNNTETSNLQQAALDSGLINSADRVLEYGFVARNGNARTIANNASGTITLGFRVPKNSNANLEPYRFTATFVVTNILATRVSRSREETATQAALRLNAITDRSIPTELYLVGNDNQSTTCNNCSITRQSNAKISSSKNLYDDPSTLARSVETVVGGVNTPWSINFAPDGSLYFTSRDSSVVTVNRLNLTTNAITTATATSAVRDEGEGGVLGLEFAPDFATTSTIFVCYSYFVGGVVNNQNRRNRLSSFTVAGTQLTNEIVLFDNMLGWSNHNGCRVANGPDGKLYFSMGDAADYNANSDGASDPANDGTGSGANKAQVKTSLSGKIFRINYDGSIPTDNPFYSSLTGQYRAIWSYGHRNPQGLAFEPQTNALWSTEHGPNNNDELNVIESGRNYGWDLCTGIAVTCGSLTDYKAAVAQYEPNGSTTIAISDMVFYNANAFPEWRGNLFFVSLKTGRLYRLNLNGQTVQSQQILIDNLYGRIRDVTVGQDGFIYFATDQSTNSTIYRLKPQ